MRRLLFGLAFAALLGVAPSLAFDRGDLNRVLGAIFDNGNPMNDKDVQCRGCDLREADLSHSEMRSADLFEADLTGADLTGVDLWNGDLRYANLTNANLSYADLTGVNLTGAILTDADLTGVRFCNTTMPNGRDRSDGCMG